MLIESTGLSNLPGEFPRYYYIYTDVDKKCVNNTNTEKIIMNHMLYLKDVNYKYIMFKIVTWYDENIKTYENFMAHAVSVYITNKIIIFGNYNSVRNNCFLIYNEYLDPKTNTLNLISYSNFSNDYIVKDLYIDNCYWLCVETYIQCGKFLNEPITLEKRTMSGESAIKYGNDKSKIIIPNWDTKYKFERLIRGLYAKFSSSQYREDLLKTNNYVLLYYTYNYTPVENFYSGGELGLGFNVLGIALMFIRQYINKINWQNIHEYVNEFIEILKSYNINLACMDHTNCEGNTVDCTFLKIEVINKIKESIKKTNTLPKIQHIKRRKRRIGNK